MDQRWLALSGRSPSSAATSPEAHYNQADIALTKENRLDDAGDALRACAGARQSRTIPGGHRNLGNVLAKQGRLDDAGDARYRQALAPRAGFRRGGTTALAPRSGSAALQARRWPALSGRWRLEPDFADAHYNLRQRAACSSGRVGRKVWWRPVGAPSSTIRICSRQSALWSSCRWPKAMLRRRSIWPWDVRLPLNETPEIEIPARFVPALSACASRMDDPRDQLVRALSEPWPAPVRSCRACRRRSLPGPRRCDPGRHGARRQGEAEPVAGRGVGRILRPRSVRRGPPAAGAAGIHADLRGRARAVCDRNFPCPALLAFRRAGLSMARQPRSRSRSWACAAHSHASASSTITCSPSPMRRSSARWRCANRPDRRRARVGRRHSGAFARGRRRAFREPACHSPAGRRVPARSALAGHRGWPCWRSRFRLGTASRSRRLRRFDPGPDPD